MKGITEDDPKVVLLLHTAGMGIQELYFTLTEDTSSYDNCTGVLDGYFTPKRNIPFERHLVRKLGQNEGETIDQFVFRYLAYTFSLRRRGNPCRKAWVDACVPARLGHHNAGCNDAHVSSRWIPG